MNLTFTPRLPVHLSSTCWPEEPISGKRLGCFQLGSLLLAAGKAKPNQLCGESPVRDRIYNNWNSLHRIYKQRVPHELCKGNDISREGLGVLTMSPKMSIKDHLSVNLYKSHSDSLEDGEIGYLEEEGSG